MKFIIYNINLFKDLSKHFHHINVQKVKTLHKQPQNPNIVPASELQVVLITQITVKVLKELTNK